MIINICDCVNIWLLFFTACKTSVDLVILLDASGSIKQDWVKEVQFAQNVINNFQIGPDAARVGIIYFGSKSVRHLDINKESSDNAAVQQKLNSLYEVGQYIKDNYTVTHAALEDAVKMFRDIPQKRQNIPKLVMVLTDGESTEHSKVISPVEDLKQLNVIRLTIGVALQFLGPKRRAQAKRELEFMASTVGGKQLNFEIDNFNVLLASVNRFAKTICDAPAEIIVPARKSNFTILHFNLVTLTL